MGWPIFPMLYKMHFMFLGTWAQEPVGRFNQKKNKTKPKSKNQLKNHSKEKYVILGYFYDLVSSLNIL